MDTGGGGMGGNYAGGEPMPWGGGGVGGVGGGDSGGAGGVGGAQVGGASPGDMPPDWED